MDILQCLIYFFPSKGKIVVVDLGSLMGVKTKYRSTDEPCVNSLPEARNILIFDREETVILELCSKQISINPKECLICMDAPRELKFQCGHHVVCSKCYDSIVICPLVIN